MASVIGQLTPVFFTCLGCLIGFKKEAQGKTCAEDGPKGGEKDTYDLLHSSNNALGGPAAGRGTGAVPDSDAPGQDALNVASVEGGRDWGQGSADETHHRSGG